MLHKAQLSRKDDNNKLLQEYETLLKNIILSERILKQIRSKDKEMSRGNLNKPSIGTDRSQSVLSKRGNRSNASAQNSRQREQINKDNMNPSCPTVINRKLTKSFEEQSDMESMDSVTALATQLLQDELVPIAAKHNNHKGLSAQQACSLNELLPRLRNMMILSGNDELIHLVQHAQTAARRILQSYGSFVNSALSLAEDSGIPNVLNGVPEEMPVSELDHRQTADSNHFHRTNRGTQMFSECQKNFLGKVDACTMTQNQDRLVTTTETCSTQTGTNEAIFPKQVQCVQTAPSTSLAVKQTVPPGSTSVCNENPAPHPSEDKQAIKFQIYKTHMAQLKRQLSMEQEQVRNLSAQLYQCQRDLEKSRLDWLQREAQLQVDLRAFRDREAQLVKSNTELRNELHLAEYHIDQLQFRLSHYDQLPHKTPTMLPYNNAGTPFDSDRTIKSYGPGQTGPRVVGSVLSDDPPAASSDKRPFNMTVSQSAFERNGLQALGHQRTKGASTIHSSTRCGNLPGSDRNSTHRANMRFDAVLETHNAAKSNFPTNVPQKDSWDSPSDDDLTAENIDNQLVGSVTGRSSEDASSLHSVDELEFRKGLAQLDERIDCMRRALHPDNPISTV